MAKNAALGQRFLIDGFDVSGDISAITSLASPLAVQDVTSIVSLAHERIGLVRDGSCEFATLWNPNNASTGDAIHTTLKARPVTDRQVTWLVGQALGAPAVSIVSKQINYDWNRNADGSMTGGTNVQANGYGLSWGVNLTAGKRTEATAGNGSTVDLGSAVVSYSQGWSAYLHVTALTGTSVTVKIQDSADASAWTDLASATFAAATAIGAQRIGTAYGSTATVRRYVRVVTTGTYTNAVYAVNFVRNEAAGYPA